MINHEHNYRADCSYHDTRQVHAGDSNETEFGENRVPDDGANDGQDDIPPKTFPLRFTILLPMKPAMSPTTSHDKMPMNHLYSVFDCLGHRTTFASLAHTSPSVALPASEATKPGLSPKRWLS